MDSRRHRADNSIPDQPTANTTQDAPQNDLDPTPDLRSEQTDAPKPNAGPHDHPPPPAPDHEHSKPDHHREPVQYKEPDHHAEPEEREEPDSHGSDRSADPPSTDAQPDPFASYPPELRAHMHHDDTLSRLQYLSNPLPESDRTSDGVPGEPAERVVEETDDVVENSAADVQPEPSSADTLPDVADIERPTSTEDELETAKAQADGAAQEPTADPIPSDESAGRVERMTLDTEVNGEAVEARVDRWDPERANLPVRVPDDAQDAGSGDSEAEPMNLDEAVDYVTTMKSERPWLEPAADCGPRIQRIHAAIDLGAGHAHIRHGAMGDDELYRRRVAYLEDPAQLDEAKRMAGVDGFKADKMHFCADTATRINDATAFAVAYAGVVEHPDVRQVLDAGADQPHQPHAIEIPLAELLGTDGHGFCSGYRLTGDWAESNAIRKEWVIARAEGQDMSGLQEPQTERISSFENGTMMVRFARNPTDQTFYIATMFVQPPPDED